MDASASATIALQKAQATQIYAGLNLWPSAVTAKLVQSQLAEDGTYPGAEGIFAAAASSRPPTSDAFPASSGSLAYLTEPREANGRWTTGEGTSSTSIDPVAFHIERERRRERKRRKRMERERARREGNVEEGHPPKEPEHHPTETQARPSAPTSLPEALPDPSPHSPASPPAGSTTSASPSSLPDISKSALSSDPALLGKTDLVRKFTLAETAGLVKLFKGGGEDGNEIGAQRLLDQIDQGKVDLPSDVTRDFLERYALIARKAIEEGKDKRDVQVLRLRAINQILGNSRYDR